MFLARFEEIMPLYLEFEFSSIYLYSQVITYLESVINYLFFYVNMFKIHKLFTTNIIFVLKGDI